MFEGKESKVPAKKRATARHMTEEPPQPWVTDFLLTCGVRFGLFFALFQIEPLFPLFLKNMDASPVMIGLVMAAFPFGATVVRPLVGLFIDQVGRKFFLLSGLLIFMTATLGYVWTTSVVVALLLRTYHGFGWSGCTTSIGTLTADIAPAGRRGEMIGYAGAMSTVAGAIAPVVGFFAVERWGFPAMFSIALGVVALSLAGALSIKEPLRAQVATIRRGWLETLVVRESLMPAVSMGLLGFSRGSVIAFLALYALGIGLENPGYWFGLYAVAVVVSRPIVGPISDRCGRAVVIIPCFVLTLVGMLLLSFAQSPTVLMIAAVIIGFGYGAVHPSLMTLAFDLAPYERRGMTMAQFHLFYDLAIGFGSVIPGIILDLTENNYPVMFLTATGVGALGLVLFLATDRSQRVGAG